jgi:hypothetical protein
MSPSPVFSASPTLKARSHSARRPTLFERCHSAPRPDFEFSSDFLPPVLSGVIPEKELSAFVVV